MKLPEAQGVAQEQAEEQVERAMRDTPHRGHSTDGMELSDVKDACRGLDKTNVNIAEESLIAEISRCSSRAGINYAPSMSLRSRVSAITRPVPRGT